MAMALDHTEEGGGDFPYRGELSAGATRYVLRLTGHAENE
jgi:hypothetical protein